MRAFLSALHHQPFCLDVDVGNLRQATELRIDRQAKQKELVMYSLAVWLTDQSRGGLAGEQSEEGLTRWFPFRVMQSMRTDPTACLILKESLRGICWYVAVSQHMISSISSILRGHFVMSIVWMLRLFPFIFLTIRVQKVVRSTWCSSLSTQWISENLRHFCPIPQGRQIIWCRLLHLTRAHNCVCVILIRCTLTTLLAPFLSLFPTRIHRCLSLSPPIAATATASFISETEL